MLQSTETSMAPSSTRFAPKASTLPGSEDEQRFTRLGHLQTEIWPFFLFALTGMLVFPAANDLLLIFVALEVMSLPLYLLVGMARRRRLLSQEAALKYFLLGAFSSAFFLYGAAMLYGYSGSLGLVDIANAVANKPGEGTLVAVGMALVMAGVALAAGVWALVRERQDPASSFADGVDRIMAMVPATTTVYWVGMYLAEPQWAQVHWRQNNAAMKAAVAKHPNAVFLDYAGYVAADKVPYKDDGSHPTARGMAMRAHWIVSNVR